MSRNYDNWEKLVGAVLRREKDRQLAFCESFSTSTSLDFGSRSSFFSIGDDDEIGRSSGQRFDPEYLSSQNVFFSRNVKGIDYEEIKKASRNFHIPEGIGATNLFALVFKGWIHEENLTATKPGCGIAVAVHIIDPEGFQQYKEWVDEINYWSSLSHPNLVKLVGCSFDTQNRILVVHEFMGRGSLDNALRSNVLLGERASFSWARRVAVAVGAARALAFLHDMEIPVVNRSITSSNILLDGEFNTKLMYFGLRKDGPSLAMGRFGYDAPEYTETGSLTSKSDVYSFGLILLELMSGSPVMDAKDMHNLLNWAIPYLKNRRRVSQIMDSRLEDDAVEPWRQSDSSYHVVRHMELNEIIEATKNFRSDMFIGEGAFCKVYKGWIDENTLTASEPGLGMAVTVKIWHQSKLEQQQNWLKKIEYLSQLRHPNLADLIGYCTEEDNIILVYEFMQEGSLENHLLKKKHQALPWVTRIKVALDVSRGLSYLHEREIPVIHRAFKTASILLDEEFNAKLSNYCYGTDDPTSGMTQISTNQLFVTHGYNAPEAKDRLSTKSNVYTFGAVLLELLSGIPAQDLNWAKPYFSNKRKLLQIMDIGLEGRYSHDAAYRVSKLALKCLSLDPELRPSMADVVIQMQQLQRL